MRLAQFKQLVRALVVLEEHRVRDLVLLVGLCRFGRLAGFLDVLEVLVESLRNAAEFLLALVLVAELEESGCALVVLLHHAAVLAQGVQNDQLRLNEELNARPQGVLFNQDVDVAVGQ